VPKDKDTRVVPLPRAALAILEQLTSVADEGQTYVFVYARGPSKGRRVTRNNIWRDFQVIRRRAGIAGCSMHDLQGSYCTNLAEHVPMHLVQELAGHSDIRTTRQYYLRVRPELMEKARETVDVLVAG